MSLKFERTVTFKTFCMWEASSAREGRAEDEDYARSYIITELVDPKTNERTISVAAFRGLMVPVDESEEPNFAEFLSNTADLIITSTGLTGGIDSPEDACKLAEE